MAPRGQGKHRLATVPLLPGSPCTACSRIRARAGSLAQGAGGSREAFPSSIPSPGPVGWRHRGVSRLWGPAMAGVRGQGSGRLGMQRGGVQGRGRGERLPPALSSPPPSSPSGNSFPFKGSSELGPREPPRAGSGASLARLQLCTGWRAGAGAWAGARSRVQHPGPEGGSLGLGGRAAWGAVRRTQRHRQPPPRRGYWSCSGNRGSSHLPQFPWIQSQVQGPGKSYRACLCLGPRSRPGGHPQGRCWGLYCPPK